MEKKLMLGNPDWDYLLKDKEIDGDNYSEIIYSVSEEDALWLYSRNKGAIKAWLPEIDIIETVIYNIDGIINDGKNLAYEIVTEWGLALARNALKL